MRTFIISGAGGNLGAATVHAFLQAGHRVIAVARENSPALQFAAGHEAFWTESLDLEQEENAAAFVQSVIERFGRIDGLLALAGGFAPGDLPSTDTAALHRMFKLNFETAYHLVRPLFPHLLANGFGRIVLVGSRSALKAHDAGHALPYALSKGLLFQLADILNAMAKGKNVTASVIVPAVIDTPQNRKAMPDADTGKWVRPEEIAQVLAYLCSEAGDALREPLLKFYGNG